jgi:probable rRNA maturation factor
MRIPSVSHLSADRTTLAPELQMIEVEVLGLDTVVAEATAEGARASAAGPVPTLAEVQRLCVLAAATAGVREGHVAIEFVDAGKITQLNAEYRREPTATDVLSFPVDGVELLGARELGDVVICPAHTVDLREAVVHGVLHLVGMDHETDSGEMLALQRELLAQDRSESP